MSAIKDAFSGAKIPPVIRASTPTRADDPAALRAREELLSKNAQKGYSQLILAPLQGAGPMTSLKSILGA